jgi:hypothetical protein
MGCSVSNLVNACLLAACALLAGTGCSSAIKSKPYVAGQSYEGIRYHLSKTTVVVQISAKLVACDPNPVIVLNNVDVQTPVSADSSTSYVINPRDSVNWFRNVDVAKIVLSDDGRLSESEAKAIDKTSEVVLQIAKAAFANRSVFSPEESLRFERGNVFDVKSKETSKVDVPIACTDEAKRAITTLRQAEEKLSEFVDNKTRSLLAVPTLLRGAEERLSAIDIAEVQFKARVLKAEQQLVKLASISLTAATNSKPAEAYLDLSLGWVEPSGARPTSLGCLESKNAAGDVDYVAYPLCLKLTAQLENPQAKTASGASTGTGVEEPSYAGFFFRVPGTGNLSVAAIVADAVPANSMILASPKVPLDSRLRSEVSDWVLSRRGEKEVPHFTLKTQQAVRVLQFGPIARMPSDTSIVTTNSVQTKFNALGVPKSSDWTSQALPVASLLGLPAQIAGLRPVTSPGLSASQVLQGNLFDRLLQSCIDALTAGAALPGYCATLSR